jgi:hypothetical protein
MQGLPDGDGRSPTIDHIVPLVANGTESADNLRCACRRCNTEKGSQPIWDKLRLLLAPGIREDVVILLPAPPTLEHLIELWRYYYFDGDDPQEWWNKPPHPMVEPIARAYPREPPAVVVKSLRIYAATDAPGQLISETAYSDGKTTIKRRRVNNG